jgi:hypothetical protein
VERAKPIGLANARAALKTKKPSGAAYENAALRIIIKPVRIARNFPMSPSVRISTIFSQSSLDSFSARTAKPASQESKKSDLMILPKKWRKKEYIRLKDKQ